MKAQLNTKRSVRECPPEKLFGGSIHKEYAAKGPNGLCWTGNPNVLWDKIHIIDVDQLSCIDWEQSREWKIDPNNVDDLVVSFNTYGWKYDQEPIYYEVKDNVNVVKSGVHRVTAKRNANIDSAIVHKVVFLNEAKKRLAAIQFNNHNPSKPNTLRDYGLILHDAVREGDIADTVDAKIAYIQEMTENPNVSQSNCTKIINLSLKFGKNSAHVYKYNAKSLKTLCKKNNIPYAGDKKQKTNGFVTNDKGFRLLVQQILSLVVASDKGKRVRIELRGLIDAPAANEVELKRLRTTWFEELDKQCLGLISSFYRKLSGEKMPKLNIYFKGFIAQDGSYKDGKRVVNEPEGSVILKEWMKSYAVKCGMKFE